MKADYFSNIEPLNFNNSDVSINKDRLKSIELPFTVRIVRTEEQLLEAVNIRTQTYERHHPSLANLLEKPEQNDRTSDSLVLLAQSKSSNLALGTLRIETNLSKTLRAESLLVEAPKFHARTVAFVTRLGVRQSNESQLVKVALFKALHRYCLAKQIDWIVVTAKPPMDRQYLKLGFSDVYDPNVLIPIPWSDNIKTRLLSLETMQAESEWRSSNHPLYQFMIRDYCPDIRIFDSVAGSWGQPRKDPLEQLQLKTILRQHSDTVS